MAFNGARKLGSSQMLLQSVKSHIPRARIWSESCKIVSNEVGLWTNHAKVYGRCLLIYLSMLVHVEYARRRTDSSRCQELVEDHIAEGHMPVLAFSLPLPVMPHTLKELTETRLSIAVKSALEPVGLDLRRSTARRRCLLSPPWMNEMIETLMCCRATIQALGCSWTE